MFIDFFAFLIIYAFFMLHTMLPRFDDADGRCRHAMLIFIIFDFRDAFVITPASP